MNLSESNAIVAHYYEELTFRARRFGIKVKNSELADLLGYVDPSPISKWLAGEYPLSQEKLNEVVKFIAKKEQLIGSKELLEGLLDLISYLEQINSSRGKENETK